MTTRTFVSPKQREEFLETAECLFKLETGATITIVFDHLIPDDITPEVLTENAETASHLSPVLVRLKDAGHTVIVRAPSLEAFSVRDAMMGDQWWAERMHATIKEKRKGSFLAYMSMA
jgi:hypothetical protein